MDSDDVLLESVYTVAAAAAAAVAVNIYSEIGAPPVFGGANHTTSICESDPVADRIAGGSGSVYGVTGSDGSDTRLILLSDIVATHVNVYAVPFARPDTTAYMFPVVTVYPPGLDVTVYDTIVKPLFIAGAVH